MSFLCALLFLIALSGQAYSKDYPVATAEKGQWQQKFTAFGRITARAESTIMMPFSLKVTEVRVEPGQMVPAGAILLRCNAPQLLKDLNNYQNSRKIEALSEKRQQVIRQGAREHTLTRQQVIAAEQAVVRSATEKQQFWDQMHTDLMILNNNLDQKDVDAILDKNTPPDAAIILGVLHAPFKGIALNRPPQVGLWIQANSALLEFEDLHRVYVTVDVPDNVVNNWLTGDTVLEKKTTLFPLKRIPGEPGIDVHNGMRVLLFTVDNRDSVLRDGEWAGVTHHSPKKEVVWIPESAVVGRNGKTWCIVSADQTYRAQPVVVGSAIDGRIPVLSGLTAGQQVVTENGYELLYRDLKELIQFVD